MCLRAFHDACFDNRFIWGGHFNTGLVLLHTYMAKSDSRYIVEQDDASSAVQSGSNQRGASSAAQPGSLRVLFSHPVNYKLGDMALTYGLTSVQENSKVGKFSNGVSDAHDLVIARVFGTASTNSAARTKPRASSPPPRPCHERGGASPAHPTPSEERDDGRNPIAQSLSALLDRDRRSPPRDHLPQPDLLWRSSGLLLTNAQPPLIWRAATNPDEKEERASCNDEPCRNARANSFARAIGCRLRHFG